MTVSDLIAFIELPKAVKHLPKLLMLFDFLFINFIKTDKIRGFEKFNLQPLKEWEEIPEVKFVGWLEWLSASCPKWLSASYTFYYKLDLKIEFL